MMTKLLSVQPPEQPAQHGTVQVTLCLVNHVTWLHPERVFCGGTCSVAGHPSRESNKEPFPVADGR